MYYLTHNATEVIPTNEFMLMTKNPKESQKLIPITVKLPPQVLKAAKALMGLRETTRSALFRDMIESAVIQALQAELEYALAHPDMPTAPAPKAPPEQTSPPLVSPEVLSTRTYTPDPTPTEPVLQLSDFELALLGRSTERL